MVFMVYQKRAMVDGIRCGASRSFLAALKVRYSVGTNLANTGTQLWCTELIL